MCLHLILIININIIVNTIEKLALNLSLKCNPKHPISPENKIYFNIRLRL
jgi:hypothetical protein